jgi:hypothetical protein
MWVHGIAILGLGALCGGWIVVQRFVEHHNPGHGHPTRGGCGSCNIECDERGSNPQDEAATGSCRR